MSAADTALAQQEERFSFSRRLEEISMFFAGGGKEHKAMRSIAERLEQAKIVYAVMGAMAVNAHRYERTTKDVDVLLTPQGFREFRTRWVPEAYEQVKGRPRRLIDSENQCTVDILLTGLFPGTGAPGPIAFPDPLIVGEIIEGIRVINLPTLIELKLAARRWQDYADVVKLIAANNLDESFAHRLHESVRNDYVECVEEQRREAEYDARQLGAGGDEDD